MSDKLYLGIDGGGTKTAFALMNSDLKIISYKEVGPSSLDTVSFETLKKVLEEGTKDITQTVDSIFLGLGGIYSKEQEMKVCELTKELNIVAPHTKIDASNDVINALYGALGGKDGIVLIAGTGSVCYVKNNGKTFRVGGYCYKEGDLGSAYDLGYKALQYLAKVIDKREEETSFSKRLKETINCYTYEDLTRYYMSATRTDVASLARVVTLEQNEEHAKSIIKSAVSEVLRMISTCYKELKFEENTIISIIGSLGNADTYYKELLLEGIKNISSNLHCEKKIYEAYYGSCLKAKELTKC